MKVHNKFLSFGASLCLLISSIMFLADETMSWDNPESRPMTMIIFLLVAIYLKLGSWQE